MIFDLGSTTPIEILLLSNRSYEARYIAGYSYKWYKPTIYLLGRSFPRQRRKRQKKKRSAFMRVIKHPVSAHSKKLTLSEFFFFHIEETEHGSSIPVPLQTVFAPVFVPFFSQQIRHDAQFFDPEKIVPLRVTRILEKRNEGTVHSFTVCFVQVVFFSQ